LLCVVRKHGLADLSAQVDFDESKRRVVGQVVEVGEPLLVAGQLSQQDVVLNLLDTCLDLQRQLRGVILVLLGKQLHADRVHVKVLPRRTLIEVMTVFFTFWNELLLLANLLLKQL
jgi:hypothetical protein